MTELGSQVTPYNPTFDRFFNIFATILSQRSDLSPEDAASKAKAVYKILTDA